MIDTSQPSPQPPGPPADGAPNPPRRISARALSWALAAAVVAAAATVAIGSRLTRDEPEYEGTVVLDEPGIFQEPGLSSNPDVTGTPLPEVTFLDTDDAERTLDEFRGAPVVVNLWYVNCPPCARELADFAAVDAELRAAGSDIRFVGLDPQDSVERMTEFAAARGVTYDLWRDTRRQFGVEIGAVAYPVTLYVDAEGRIVRQTGETTAAEIRANLAELFGA